MIALLHRRIRSIRFAAVIAVCACATILSWLLGAPSSCFHLSIVICSLYGGRGAGIIAIALSILSFDYFFLNPHFQFAIEHSAYPRFTAFIITALCVNLVIEAKQRGDRARREAEEQHRIICDNSLDGIFSVGHQDQIRFANPAAAGILGYPTTEMMGQPISRFVPQFDREDKSSVTIMTGRHKDETDFVAEVSISRVESSDRCAAVVFVRDITERMHAENALRKSESYLAAAQRVSRTGSFGWNVSTGDIVWTEETFRIAGVAMDSKPTLHFIYERVHPEDRAMVREVMEASSKLGQDLEFEHRFVLPDGSVKFVRVLGRAVHDQKGQLEYIGAAVDITAHKIASESLREMEKRLSRASQIATLGEVSASIAHEINQPLTAIIANAHMCFDLLSSHNVDPIDARTLVQEIVDCGYHASDVVQRMRNLFKGGTFDKVALETNELIKEVFSLVRSEAAKRRIELETDLDPKLPVAVGDRVQIQQVLVNLCINAFDAMDSVVDRPRKLCVRTRAHDHASIRVEVEDSGVGLRNPERVFEAFFTTKENGMGMGLPICRSIIEQHTGTLWSHNDNAHGTTFCFTIPILDRSCEAQRKHGRRLNGQLMPLVTTAT